MLIEIIIGVCIMSVFALLALCALDAGKETLSMMLCGPAMWLWIIAAKLGYTIYKAVALYFFRRDYLVYQTYISGHLHDTYYIHKAVADLFYTTGENHDDHYVVFIKDCKDAKSLPLKQRKVTPHGIGRKYHLTENFLSKYIRPYSDFYRRMYHPEFDNI